MTFNLIDWIHQYAVKEKMDVLIDDYDALGKFIASSDCSIVDHYSWMSAYHEEYLASRYSQVSSASILLKSNGKTAGVFTINVRKNTQGYEIGSSSAEVLPPFVEQTLSRKVKHKLFKQCFNLIMSLNEELKTTKLISSFDYINGLSEPWYNLFASNGAQIKVSQNLFCDLTLSESEYFNMIRERYKNHIKRSQKLWGVDVKTEISWQEFLTFKQLHLDVAGFKTRSDLTWEMLFDAVNRQEAFIVFAMNQSNKLIGAALFTVANKVATYAVGVYDRTLFSSPVSHLVHYYAIKKMKDLGLNTYFLGAKNALHEWHAPSIKESTIGDFKEGFATFSFLKTYCSIDLK